jgi:hypothetical protein
MSKRSAPMMFASQQRFKFKLNEPPVDAEADHPAETSVVEHPVQPLQRGSIFKSSNKKKNSSGIGISDSLLMKLANMEINRSSFSSFRRSKQGKSISPSRTQSKDRVHSRRRNRITIIDSKIFMKYHHCEDHGDVDKAVVNSNNSDGEPFSLLSIDLLRSLSMEVAADASAQC